MTGPERNAKASDGTHLDDRVFDREAYEREVVTGPPADRDLRDERDQLADALEWLVRLKDGPRDDAYEHDKPLAWDLARALLASGGSGEAPAWETIPKTVPSRRSFVEGEAPADVKQREFLERHDGRMGRVDRALAEARGEAPAGLTRQEAEDLIVWLWAHIPFWSYGSLRARIEQALPDVAERYHRLRAPSSTGGREGRE